MNRESLPIEHVHALLVDRALQGADAAEEAGLNCLLQHYPELDAEEFDRTAAALDLALSHGEEEPLPAGLMNRLQVQGASINLEPKKTSSAAPVIVPLPAPSPVRRGAGSSSPLIWAGWLVAAVVLFFAVVPQQPPKLSYSQLKERGALVVEGAKGPHGKSELRGEFVWDSNTQQGYMKLSGFDINDPKVSQYQLWIFDDREFTAVTPIDGGVFDVKNSKEVLIPIKPNIKVNKSTLFAITVEKPGGVMVSKRDPLIFVGPVNPKS
jgi:hypothetical protein